MPPRPENQWSQEWEAELCTMMAGHRSFDQMAKRLTVLYKHLFTRNAVIAKADRMGLKRGKLVYANGGRHYIPVLTVIEPEPISPAMARLALHCPVTRRAMLKKVGAEAPELPTSDQVADED